MSLLISSHLPPTDASFYHVWKALGEDVERCMRDGASENATIIAPQAGTAVSYSARVLLLLGREALQSAMGLTDAPAVMGACWTAAEARAIAASCKAGSLLERLPNLHTVYACMHPHDARYARWALPTIQRIIRRAKDRVEPLGDRLAGLTINVNPTLSEWEEELYEEPLPSIDVENVKGDPGRILLIGCARNTRRASVCEWREPFISLIRKFLGSTDGALSGFNFYHDYDAFSKNGIATKRRVYDGITCEARLYPPQAERKQESDPEAGKKRFKIRWHSLQNSVLRGWDGEAPWKRVEELRWVQAYYRVAYPSWSEYEWARGYCALDVLKTRRLIEVQRERMEQL